MKKENLNQDLLAGTQEAQGKIDEGKQQIKRIREMVSEDTGSLAHEASVDYLTQAYTELKGAINRSDKGEAQKILDDIFAHKGSFFENYQQLKPDSRDNKIE